jgi:hypothetical protein
MTTNPIPIRRTTATPKTRKMTVFELERDVVSVEAVLVGEVFPVLVVGVGSWAP